MWLRLFEVSRNGGRLDPMGLLMRCLNLVEIPSLLEVMTEGISLLFTPDGLSNPREITSLKSAITNFSAKPDKSDEDLNLIRNLRPITLRVVFFKIFTMILERLFTSSLERKGTIDEEQQGFRCKRSVRRVAHSRRNILGMRIERGGRLLLSR